MNLDPRKTGHEFMLGLGTTGRDELNLTVLTVGINKKLGVEERHLQKSCNSLSPRHCEEGGILITCPALGKA